MNFLKTTFVRFVFPHLAAFLLVMLTSQILQPLKTYLSIQIIVLIYLLPVMVSTVLWGLTPGILAAFLAFLVFNYYNLQPYGTFQVHATQDVITLIIFLIVSVVTSQLIGQAREGIRMARRREWEATRMYELISALAGLQAAQKIGWALAKNTLETFQGERVEVSIEEPRGGAAFTINLPEGQAPAEAPHKTIPLKTARSREGELRLWLHRPQLTAEEERLLEAYTSQGALALERIRLARGENKARVLEESDRLKSSLLNSVAHELRSPLAAIKASVSSLRSRAVPWESPARDDLLATIEEETDHLNRLVGNLLDMSRIESGALEPHMRWNAIGEIAMSVVSKMRKQLEGHTLKTDFPEDLPLAPTDYVMIEQVFTNLISNSIKYAPAGSQITISSREDNGRLHTVVTNQGPVVPPDHLERIFDKFYRVTEADRITGTGLGLSICKGLVEAHGGTIWAENQPGGFAFHFLLPLTLHGALPAQPKEIVDG